MLMNIIFSKVPYNGEYISVKNAGGNNGISTTLERNDRTGYIKALGNIYLQYQPVKGLILKSSFWWICFYDGL